MLAYTGKSPNRRCWKGPVTDTRYYFGPGDVGLVDKRDALIMLAPRGGGKAFELVRE